ncbi:hypothetical protein [Prosthecobacter sp.]|uniref:hypothetical protein n=1 Tax=Prosthecobacter sp. TaxID=1965333 RepID=UPI003784AF7A
MHWRFWMMLLFGFTLYPKSGAQEPATLLTARITAVKESDWQREMAQPAKPEGLRERLKARTLVELSGVLNEDDVTLLSIGKEQAFGTEWDLRTDPQRPKTTKTEKHLIGTEMRVKHERLDDEGLKVRLEISLSHDLQPPQTQPLTYANAAVGAERDKHTVPMPRFERLRWKGDVMASQEERMLASFPSPQDAGTRIVVFLQGGAAVSKTRALTTVRQTLYRMPELDMIEWLMKAPRDDAAVIHHLEEAQAAGQASVVSSAALAMTPGRHAEAQAGTEHWMPSEMDQHFDQLYLVPAAYETLLQGTRLVLDNTPPPDLGIDASHVSYISTFAPRPPLTVQWPTSWLRARDEKGVSSRAIHGRMDWHDRFEEELTGSVLFSSVAPHVVAMMPPPDQVWGAERQGRWLDVTVAQQPDWTAGPAAETSPSPPRRMFIGIALDSDAAHALLAARQAGQDDAPLLRDLLARARHGQARVMSFALTAHETARRRMTSARQHDYPTEMPSIPSAWEKRAVGTELEYDDTSMALTQHLAPPARTEWRLARDVPEAIMWQPRFRQMHLATTSLALNSPGTHLLSAADVPAVMAAADLPATECLLYFSHLDSGTTSAIESHDYEIETQIFEFASQDAASWQAVKPEEFETFSRQKLKSGRATLQSHTLLRSNPLTSASLSVAEEYRTAVDFDPPTKDAPLRMRPTGLNDIPVGQQLEVELAEDPAGIVSAKIKLQHSTDRPVEPSLEETLRISANEDADYPGARHELDEWSETISPPFNQFYPLAPPTSTSGDQGKTRSAWVRVRRVK